MEAPQQGEDWLAVAGDVLDVARVADWVVLPSCGAVVCFVGTVRDHAEGRVGVEAIDYEVFADQMLPRMEAVAAEARKRWTELGRVAIIHRHGLVKLGEASVVVAVSTPHRAQAFAAASYCMEEVKATLPVWKKEHWPGGEDWALASRPISEPGSTQ